MPRKFKLISELISGLSEDLEKRGILTYSPEPEGELDGESEGFTATLSPETAEWLRRLPSDPELASQLHWEESSDGREDEGAAPTGAAGAESLLWSKDLRLQKPAGYDPTKASEAIYRLDDTPCYWGSEDPHSVLIPHSGSTLPSLPQSCH